MVSVTVLDYNNIQRRFVPEGFVFEKRDTPSDYCFLDTAPGYRLTQFERLTLTGGEELSRAVDWLARQFSTISSGIHLGRVDASRVVGAAGFYSQGRWADDPESFFADSHDSGELKIVPVHGLSDGQVLDLEFPSTYQPRNPDYVSDFERFSENRTVYARVWKHHGRGRATILAIHGWTMGDQRLNSLAFLPGVFYDLGLDVAMIELPFHGRRRPVGDNRASFLFPDADVVRANESVAQAISDLRQLRKRLETLGFCNVGCVGMSLGGYVGALWASLDPLAFCVPVVPLVSMDEMVWTVLESRPELCAGADGSVTFELLADVFRVHSPLRFQPKLPPERILIIAGKGDQIVHAHQSKLLWRHWGKPAIQRFSGGHVTHFGRARAIKSVIGFLASLGYVPEGVLPALLRKS